MRKIYNKLFRGDPTVIYGVCKKLADLANKKDERFSYLGVIEFSAIRSIVQFRFTHMIENGDLKHIELFEACIDICYELLEYIIDIHKTVISPFSKNLKVSKELQTYMKQYKWILNDYIELFIGYHKDTKGDKTRLKRHTLNGLYHMYEKESELSETSSGSYKIFETTADTNLEESVKKILRTQDTYFQQLQEIVKKPFE